jgi:ADP-ribose pyrophosphatase YjhB (NUDIX family)
MTQIIRGNRAAKAGSVLVGCAAVILDPGHQTVLLTRRADNGLWCLPGGGMEAGESVTEACAREVLEETGLIVSVTRLIGIYSDPDRLLVYADGNAYHVVGLCFLAEYSGGTLQLSDETIEFGYFSLEEIGSLQLLDQHRERIEDAFAGSEAAFIR